MCRKLLRCEALAGNFVWGRNGFVAGSTTKCRLVTRANNVIEPIITPELWKRVQDKLIARRKMVLDRDQLLHILREKLAKFPYVNALDLEAMGISHKKAYPLLQCIPRSGDPGEVVSVISGDSVRHDEVQRQEHARAQFSGVDVVQVHAEILEVGELKCIFPASRHEQFMRGFSVGLLTVLTVSLPAS